MPARASKPKRPRDPNELAHLIGRIATGEQEEEAPPAKNPHAQALSALGASKGGKARAAKLTAAERSEIAKRAAAMRWGERG